MTKAKRWLALLLALVCLGLAACGGNDDSGAGASGPESSTPQQTESMPDPGPTALEPLPLATDVNALTGQQRPEGMLEGQRPVAVMVSNNERSLPQRGLAAADVLVEMVTEGGITRLMALYADYNTMPQVGPVRSTRDQFVQFAMPLDAIQVHIGTSVYARNLLDVMAIKDINGLYLGSTAFWFDEARTLPKLTGKLNEYCWFTDAGLVWAGMETLDILTTGEVRQLFNFAQGAVRGQGGAATVNVTYSPVASSSFAYNAETGLYEKSIWGGRHMDESGAGLDYANLLLLSCNITLKPDGMCTEFDMTEGDGWYFTAGGMQEITWRKGAPGDALRLCAQNGRELEVQPGKSYIGWVPAEGEPVSWAA